MRHENSSRGGRFAFRPGWADTTSAGAERPRNSIEGNQRPGGGPAQQNVRRLLWLCQPFRPLVYLCSPPVAHATGKGYVGLSGLTRSLIVPLSSFSLVEILHSVAFTVLAHEDRAVESHVALQKDGSQDLRRERNSIASCKRDCSSRG